MREYDAAFNTAWLDQTAAIPKGSVLDHYLTDADQLRLDVRACQDKK